jgi:excinuclease UvrABC nuclease subunit
MSKFRFNWHNISKVSDDEYGIYSIWSKNVCLYVGKAEKQSLRKRLLQHYSGSHNDKLTLWLNSSHEKWFSVEIVKNTMMIDVKERQSIKWYAPISNVKLLKKGSQYDNIISRI